MLIKNETKKTVLSEKLLVAHTLKDNFFGLTLSREPQTMLFHTRFGIHTFGMHYPIDILVLNNNNEVVTLKHQLKPNRIFLWNPRFAIIIELPEGTISKTKTEIGDTLNLQEYER